MKCFWQKKKSNFWKAGLRSWGLKKVQGNGDGLVLCSSV